MQKFIKALSYLLAVHLLALLLMGLFRLLFYCSVSGQLTADVAGRPLLVATAFLRGLWFDNVIACYLLAPIFLVVLGFGLWGRYPKRLWTAVGGWFAIGYGLVFMAEAGNIPYYNYFSKLLNASIWNWAEYGTQTLGMVFGESSYYLYIASYFVGLALFIGGLHWLRRRFFPSAAKPSTSTSPSWLSRLGILSLGLAVAAGIGLGIRGRLGYNPIKVSAAYFCQSTVLNNLGVNPMFNLLTSTLDTARPENQKLHLLAPHIAIRNVQEYLDRTGLEGISPIARQVKPEGQPSRQNVVLVLMESMSARLMARFGNDRRLTPTLDSLYSRSLSFANCYSAGNHTNHGLYASLYSFPSIMYRNAMKGTTIPNYSGLPTVLRENGYETLFFMTHESQYDNMNAFLRTNGYEQIYAQENYPRSARVNHFGVSDGFLFDYALPVLRRQAATGRPFFATLLTISNHPPYVVPEAFQDPSLKPEEQIVRYADDCIRRFMAAATKEAWARNTLFVFVGDHGKLLGAVDCELPEAFNHVPLLIYRLGMTPREVTDFAGQVDIAPTLLGLLRIPYTQNNFGMNLLRERRPAAFYSADKTIAARSRTGLYVYNAEAQREYFYALSPSGTPTARPLDAEGQALKRYVFSMLQATEEIVGQGLTLDHPAKK